MSEDSNPLNLNKEIWQNVSRGTVVVNKFDRRGELKDELVPGGGKVSLTTDERAFNMDQAADDKLDNFRNGNLVPVRLLDNAESAAVASNPNLLGEDQMKTLVRNKRQFVSKVNEITNTTTLARLKQIAIEEDASVKQVQTIDARLEEVRTGPKVTERTQTPLPKATSAVSP